MTTAYFVVPIINDDLLEGNETFTLTLNPLLLPSDVIAGHPAEATVTIIDGAGKQIVLHKKINDPHIS